MAHHRHCHRTHGLARLGRYDRTSYTGHNASALPGHDVIDVAGVYGGWTASDVTAPVADVARLAYDIFGQSGPRILQPASGATMAAAIERCCSTMAGALFASQLFG